ncbi:MAG: hypothetical protein FJZ92_09730 [Chloroflexi bacterium]|nr:hypothetical protein [Chloroflexota bacterium]
MRRFIRNVLLLGIAAGLAYQALRRLGIVGAGECGPNCQCSLGAEVCTCGHATCLVPAPS